MTPMLINQAIVQAEQFMCVIVKKTFYIPVPAVFASLSAHTTSGSDVTENGENNEVVCCNRLCKPLELNRLRKQSINYL